MSHEHKEQEEGEENIRTRVIKLAVGLVFLTAGFVFQQKNFNSYIYFSLYLVSYLVLGFGVLKESVENLFHGELFDENFLMSLATIGAAVLGDYKEAVAVMLFYMIGETVQDLAVDKSRDNIAKLMDIAPKIARVKTNNGYKEIPPQSVKIGQIIKVLPGERVPLDGKIVLGESSLDTSSLTGESASVFCCSGDLVLSGSLVLDSPIEVECTSLYEDSTVSKIFELVEKAEANKAPKEKFITRFAKIYTPVVVVLALILALAGSLIFGNLKLWTHRALTFLVISCPCALVLSIPLAFFAGIGGMASKGILFKGANSIELLAKTVTFAFDKTGTLTTGMPIVEKVISNTEEDLLLSVAYSLESNSTHPIAKSICAYCSKKGARKLEIPDVKEIPGYGIIGNYEEKILCGNYRFMKENSIDVNEDSNCIYVAKGKKVLGEIHLVDELKTEAAECISLLKKFGIGKTVILSGDEEQKALRIGNSIGIDEVYSELLPQNKVRKMEELKQNGLVAYVGDGINDAPVLACSDVGISMGTLGSDCAVEASKIVLMNDDLSKIPLAIEGCRKTVSIAKQNIIFAIAVKLLCMVLGVFGIATMALAIFADVGVCLICVLNSMRALRF